MTDDEYPVFDEEFIRGGRRESEMRIYQAPLPRAADPGRVTQPGPRDWRAAPTATGTRRLHRRSWATIVVVGLILGGVLYLVSRTHSSGPTAAPGGGGGLPGGVGAVSPHVTNSPIAKYVPTSGASVHPEGPEVSGVGPRTALGSCFDATTHGDTTSARIVPCSGHHDHQLVSFELSSGDDAHYPSDDYWNGPVAKRCANDLLAYTGQPERNWPIALRSDYYIPRGAGWRTGDRTVYCLAEFAPASTGSVHAIRPATGANARPAHGTAVGDKPLAVVRGTLSVVPGTNGNCVAVTVNRVSTPIVSYSTRYLTLSSTTNGEVEPTRTGITSGGPSRAILFTLNQTVTLVGSYVSPGRSLACGATRAFGFTYVS